MSGAPPPIDIHPDHLALVLEILGRHVPDRKVSAFGSRATRTAGRYSDLDLAVLGDSPLPPATAAGLTDAFVESDLPFKVDVVDWAGAGEYIRGAIRRGSVTLQDP